MAKKGGSDNTAANTQAALAQQLFTQTDPLRKNLINRSAQFLGADPIGQTITTPGRTGAKGMVIPGTSTTITLPGDTSGFSGGGMTDVYASPTYQALKLSADQRFGQAKDNTISRLPGGGALLESLAGLESDRASTMTQGAGAIYEDELSRALSLATGGAAQGMSGLGMAAQSQAAMAQANAEAAAGKAGGLGTAIGGLAGFMVGGPPGAAAGATAGGAAGSK